MAQIRWDRLGRLAMLCVLVAIAYLYLSAAVSLLSTWRESRHDSAQVLALERQGRELIHQHDVLVSQSTLDIEARKLGMIRPGEQGYFVSGLPSD
jgi:cell division protein FtsB